VRLLDVIDDESGETIDPKTHPRIDVLRTLVNEDSRQ
jgi:hypothetical protein